LAILIFQDIIVIPMMLLTPLLAGISGHDNGALTHLLLKGIFLILLVLAAAKWVVPHMLYLFARTRSRELFMLSILVMCFAVAFLTQSLGLSLALGAFLAGLIVSETEFSYEALGNIVPLRDVFTSLFFISVGMLLDLKFLAQHPGHVALISLGVVVLKSSLVIFVVLLLGYPIRSGVLTGLALCQVGEFSFILFLRGVEFGLLEGQFYHLFLNVSVITMGITPFAIAIAPRLVDLATRSPLPAKLKAGLSRDVGGGGFRRRQRFEDHLVIVGFGFNGRNVARVARAAGIPYVIVEMNPQTVRGERERGEPIYYGDAAQETVLERADIKEARIVVIVISDPVGSRKITAAARNANSKAFIIVRTRFITEMQHLYNLGADQVIPEEFETSIEIFSRVLAKYLIPRNEIERLISEVRADGYEMFRTLQKESTLVSDLKLQLPDVEVITFRVEERAPIVGKSLAQVQLRKRYGITLLALQRGHELMPNPDADTTIKAKDLLVLLSLPANLAQHCDLFLTPGSKTQCV
jgi:CPA2 family monovalent cation:H+ antiporter-2